MIGILKEVLIDKLEHLPLFYLIGHFTIEPAGRQKRILALGIERQDPLKPAYDLWIIEILKRDADPRLVIKGLEPEHEEFPKHRRIPEAYELEIGKRGRGRQGLGFSLRLRTESMPA